MRYYAAKGVKMFTTTVFRSNEIGYIRLTKLSLKELSLNWKLQISRYLYNDYKQFFCLKIGKLSLAPQNSQIIFKREMKCLYVPLSLSYLVSISCSILNALEQLI